MTHLRISGQEPWERKIVLAFLLAAGLSLPAPAADTIAGTASNRTRGVPAAGDEVILLRLDRGMQEEARATTDAQGAFTLKVQVPDKPHLVRVMHQGVNYDQQVSASQAVSIGVFDAAPKVPGISGSIEIIRAGTRGSLLHISDMYEVKNDSSPPLTQAGERTFEVFLPANATIDSVLAAGPGRIGVLISAAPVPGEPGHYTVSFPLRPGATKFAFNYDIPYPGHVAFRPRLAYPLQQLAVMLPPSMKFRSRSPAFQVLATGSNDYQVEAANQLQAGEGPGFEISGGGAIPPLQARTQSQPQPPTATVPGLGLTAPGSAAASGPGKSNAAPAPAATPPLSPPSLSQWWILGAAAVVVLGTCGFVIWRKRRFSAFKTKASVPKTRQTAPPPAFLLEALKEELLQLETGRLDGSISREEYDAAKQGLEGSVRRAFMRTGAKS